MISMKKADNAFFLLLKSGLWECDLEDLSLFPLTDTEWRYILNLSVKQTVTALVYEGVCRLPEDLMPADGVMLKWVAMTDNIERRNVVMDKKVAGLVTFFSYNGLFPVLKKGQGVASFYMKPHLRECGDIDIYFPDEKDRKKAVELVVREGGKVDTMPDGAMTFGWRGTDVEIHADLLDIQNPFKKSYLLSLEREYGFVTEDIGGTGVSVPSPMLNLILLNTHIMKHALGWGIGLRQVCDMARLCYSLHGEFDSMEMKRICRKLGIDRWSRLLHGFMVENLGLDKQFLPYSDMYSSSSTLMNIIMEGGNFGFSRRGNTEEKSILIRKMNTLKSFLMNTGTALKYAPGEALFTVVDLIKGQF